MLPDKTKPKKLLFIIITLLLFGLISLFIYGYQAGKIPIFRLSMSLEDAISRSAKECKKTDIRMEKTTPDSVAIYATSLIEKKLGIKFGLPPGYNIPETVEDISIFSVPDTNTCWVAAVKIKGKSPKFIFETHNGKIKAWIVNKVR